MSFQKVALPELPYGYAGLDPIIPAEILEIHHGKHHKAYVDKYNDLGQQLFSKLAGGDEISKQALFNKVHFNLGGHNCHSLYWENLAPHKNGGGEIDTNSLLAKAIVAEWGSVDKFVEEFSKKSLDVQGSGWGWLALDPVTKLLSIETTSNQDIIETYGRTPLLTVDVWEHAYYLKYKNARAEYLKEIWKIINWRAVSDRFDRAHGHATKL